MGKIERENKRKRTRRPTTGGRTDQMRKTKQKQNKNRKIQRENKRKRRRCPVMGQDR